MQHVTVHSGKISIHSAPVEGSIAAPARDASIEDIKAFVSSAPPAYIPEGKRGLHMIKDRALLVNKLRERGCNLFD